METFNFTFLPCFFYNPLHYSTADSENEVSAKLSIIRRPPVKDIKVLIIFWWVGRMSLPRLTDAGNGVADKRGRNGCGAISVPRVRKSVCNSVRARCAARFLDRDTTATSALLSRLGSSVSSPIRTYCKPSDETRERRSAYRKAITSKNWETIKTFSLSL